MARTPSLRRLLLAVGLTVCLLPVLGNVTATSLNAAAPPQQATANTASHSATTTTSPQQATVKTAIPGQVHLSLFSPLRREQVNYDAFLPVDARPGERFPAVYLLHGAYEDRTAWAREMADLLPALATRHRLVLIAPSAGRKGWYVDSPLVSENQMESFIVKELIPHAEANLPLLPKRGALGISMGGHGAFVMGLRHPGVFASISSMSGVLDITLHPDKWGIKELLGPLITNHSRWESHSALRLLQGLPADTPLPAMLVTTGSDDMLVLQDNRSAREALQHRGARHIYRESAGNHDWTYWRSEMPQHVAFHSSVLQP